MNPKRKQYLKEFCREYKKKKNRIMAFSEYQSPSFESSGSGQRRVDSNERQIIERVTLEIEVWAIEDAIREVSGDLSPYLFLNVTEGTPFEYLDVPSSRRSFYRMKNEFFKLLDTKIS